MYAHGLYFCCCIFCFLWNRFKIFCIICAYRRAECNICCYFCDVCPCVVFLLLHILFSAEQVQGFLHNLCLQGGNCNICFCFCMSMGCIYFATFFFPVEQVFVPLYLCLQGCYVCTCISLLSNIYFKAYVSNYKMIWVFFVPWFWAPLGFYFILFLWVSLLACMAVGNDFLMSFLSFFL